MSGASMNGPFFWDRMLFRLPLHNELVGSFVVPRFVSKSRFAPGRHRMVTLDAALTATVRMVDRIHHHAANRRTNAHVSHAARLPNRHVFVIQVSHLSNR